MDFEWATADKNLQHNWEFAKAPTAVVFEKWGQKTVLVVKMVVDVVANTEKWGTVMVAKTVDEVKGSFAFAVDIYQTLHYEQTQFDGAVVVDGGGVLLCIPVSRFVDFVVVAVVVVIDRCWWFLLIPAYCALLPYFHQNASQTPYTGGGPQQNISIAEQNFELQSSM